MKHTGTFIDELLAGYHAAVWDAAENGGAAYDEAGEHIAKAIVEKIGSLETERDALAAHVEQLTAHVERAQSERIPDYCELDEAIDAAIEVRPQTSLEKLKAQWQAEALGDLLKLIPGSAFQGGCDFGCGKIAADMMAELRRQAEGEQP